MRFRLLAVPLVVATLPACQSVETNAQLTSPATGAVQTAGPGDTVLSFRATRSLPNAFGKADLFGRKVDAGQTSVRYLGTRGGRAVFERSEVSVESNATTMNQTPLLVPQVSTTTLDGTVGTTPVSARATSTGYAFVGPRPTTSYAVAERPIELTLGRDESTVIQGWTLTVTRIGPGSIDYRIR